MLEVGVFSTMPADSYPYLKYRITNPTLLAMSADVVGFTTGAECGFED
jgi:hypothetical protein